MTHTPGNGRAEQAARIAAEPWYRQLYVQVLVAIVIGIVLGWRWPDLATDMEPIGTTFITAMKMLIGPIVFLTIIGGIAGIAGVADQPCEPPGLGTWGRQVESYGVVAGALRRAAAILRTCFSVSGTCTCTCTCTGPA
ncbi:cation:dicarboxylase symporter family transporter [Streptomyces sp. NBC_00663]|uniref:cation:dicarboxylate symporter family transporter n=1 Tax=Streptomyces sp. NBC_00663 TaxID=2975801 RepID=UPI002E2F3165|nr:cation:dicarboxylase symporter family transporter [Streptomyces sp. NBC_00663]